MSGHSHSPSVESTCTVLTCTSAEFDAFYDHKGLDTEVLAEDLLRNTIRSTGQFHQALVAANKKYRLDKLLEGMLLHALTPAGKRYVVVALHIAHGKGADAMVNLAQAWMNDLFLMMLTISRASKALPSGSQTPTFDDTFHKIEHTTRAEQGNLKETLRIREGYRCAISGSFELERMLELVALGRNNEIPKNVPQNPMAAAHIIPLLFNDFDNHETQQDTARTWDMLRSWAGIDIDGSDINTPANAILMTHTEHMSFGQFVLYFDKDAFPDNPNKYKVRTTMPDFFLTTGKPEADAEFPTREVSGIDPPNPEFLRILAACAKVLNLCAAADVLAQLYHDADDEISLRMHPKYDFAENVSRRLAILAM